MSAERPTPAAPRSPEETRLHDALERVATRRPVADGWEAIVERLTDEADGTTVVTPLAGGRHGGSRRDARPSRRRLALIAACVAAVGALAVGVVALAGRDDDEGQVTLTPPPAEATGWYVPRDLPDGWVLETVGTDLVDAAEGPTGTSCPCTRDVFVGSGTALLHETWAITAGEAQLTGDPVDLGHGLVGHRMAPTSVWWSQGGRVHGLMGHTPGFEGGDGDLDDTIVTAAARTLTAVPSGADPTLDGYDLVSRNTIPDVATYRTVVVTLRNRETGRRASYGLSPTGFDVADAFAAVGAAETVEIPGQPEALDRFTINPAAAPGDADQFLYVGQWPGADVFVGRFLEPAATNPMHDADLQTVISRLRPATSAEWAAFLDAATGSVDGKARAPSLGDLIQRD